MKTFEVRKAKSIPIRAELTVPGDKSISHRAAILSSLSHGICRITGFLESEDCLATIAAMQRLGITIEHPEPGTFIIHGAAGRFSVPSGDLYCGNSGTTMRLLAGLLAAQSFRTRLTGDSSLSQRPMARVIEPLTQMGAQLTAEGEKGRPPLAIEGGSLQPISYDLPVASAQVKSAILLAALFTKGETIVTEPAACRNHTEQMLEDFRVTLTRSPPDQHGRRRIALVGPQIPEACDFHVPGDISSAAFWLVAAGAQVGSRLQIHGVGLNPTRTGILSVLSRMGARLHETVAAAETREPSGTLEIKGGGLSGTVIEGAEIANVIDELPVLAVAGALASGTTIIRDARELRVKETDRIAAVAQNLRSMGVTVTEREDGMEIQGGSPLRGATLRSFGDHRIAMAFAIAGLFAKGKTVIEDVECVDTSYPGSSGALSMIMEGGHRQKGAPSLGRFGLKPSMKKT